MVSISVGGKLAGLVYLRVVINEWYEVQLVVVLLTGYY